jgi:hypothetical protein
VRLRTVDDDASVSNDMTITTAQENLMWVGHIPGNVDHSIGVLLTKAVPISDEFGTYVIGLSLQTHSAGLTADQVAKLIHTHLREKCGLCSCLYAPRYLVMDSAHIPHIVGTLCLDLPLYHFLSW